MKEKKWFCMVAERGTGKELASYEDIVALDLYWAKHKAADRYEAENPGVNRNAYCVEAVCLE